MLLSHIVACGKNRIIGKNGGMPWKIPGEQRRFKSITSNKTVIMGRKTFDSLNNPLEKRNLVVISQSLQESTDNIQVFNSISEAINSCSNDGEIFIAGGGEIYKETFPLIDRIYLTMVDSYPDGDVTYPDFELDHFFISFREKIDSASKPYTYYTLERTLKPCSKSLDNYLEISDTNQQFYAKAKHLKEKSDSQIQYMKYILDHIASLSERYSNKDILHETINLLRYNKIPSGFCSIFPSRTSIAVYCDATFSWVILDTFHKTQAFDTISSFPDKIGLHPILDEFPNIHYIHPSIDALAKFHQDQSI